MKIGILECGHLPDEIIKSHAPYPDLYMALLAGHGFEFESWDIENLVFPKDINAADGWLLTGSRHGAYEDHPFIAPLESFIRKAYDASVPMVGICFGHQIIAQTLGGKVGKFSDGWAIGRNEYTFDDHGPLALNAWHQDQVLIPPNDARTFASSPFCSHAALVYGDRAWSVQPHPEFSARLITDLVCQFRVVRNLPDDVVETAASLSDVPTQSATIASDIARFFKTARP